MITGKNYIGNTLSAKGTKTYQTFNPKTNIEFQIPKTQFTTLKIYNALGQIVVSLVSEELNPGNYNYSWDASNYSSGVYFYQLDAGQFVQTKKLLLIK